MKWLKWMYNIQISPDEQVYMVLEPYHYSLIGNFTWQNDDACDEVGPKHRNYCILHNWRPIITLNCFSSQ